MADVPQGHTTIQLLKAILQLSHKLGSPPATTSCRLGDGFVTMPRLARVVPCRGQLFHAAEPMPSAQIHCYWKSAVHLHRRRAPPTASRRATRASGVRATSRWARRLLWPLSGHCFRHRLPAQRERQRDGARAPTTRSPRWAGHGHAAHGDGRRRYLSRTRQSCGKLLSATARARTIRFPFTRCIS